MRHTKAVKRVATAYLKLLFPHVTSVDMLNLDEFNMYCLQPAIRRRDIVREQCSNIDAESSFSNQCLNILYCLVNLICMMTREEKIENLNTVSVIVTDLAVTFDM